MNKWPQRPVWSTFVFLALVVTALNWLDLFHFPLWMLGWFDIILIINIFVLAHDIYRYHHPKHVQDR